MVDDIWYVYILQCSDGTYYTGITKDLKRRVDEHNTSAKGSKYTRSRRPVKLIYFSEHESRSSAQKSEYSLKQRTRQQKEEIINKATVPSSRG
jgi:putative endonuclease